MLQICAPGSPLNNQFPGPLHHVLLKVSNAILGPKKIVRFNVDKNCFCLGADYGKVLFKDLLTSAALHSLVATAKANGLRPYYSLRYLFERLPVTETEDDYRNLLPQNFSPGHIALPAK